MSKEQKSIHHHLIESCRKGDKKAMMQLYRNYHQAVYSTCLRFVGNRAEAEDIMQETFIRAFEKLDQYRGEVAFGAWLKRIAINKSLDFVRQKPGHIDFVAELPEEQEDDDSNYSEYVNYQLEEIKTAVPKLPSRYRTVLSLFLFEGYDHDEISDILNISNSASRTRYSRAKNRLLRILSEQSVMKMFVQN